MIFFLGGWICGVLGNFFIMGEEENNNCGPRKSSPGGSTAQKLKIVGKLD